MIKEILQPLIDRTKEFLNVDMDIKVNSFTELTLNKKSIVLKRNTALISISGNINFLVALSYEDYLLDMLVQKFLDGEKLIEEDKNEIYESVSMEIANIIIGNALANPDKTLLTISTPIFIYEAKSLSRSKSANTLVSTISTEYGNLSVFAIY